MNANGDPESVDEGNAMIEAASLAMHAAWDKACDCRDRETAGWCMEVIQDRRCPSRSLKRLSIAFKDQ